jgi:cytidylate kinase
VTADPAPVAAEPALASLVVAVDGPSGAGKSSVSRALARRFGLRYLDTGAMYRALTWWMLENEVDVHDADEVAAVCDKPHLEVGTDPTAPTITVDGVDVGGVIRSRAVTSAVSAVSAVDAVRARLVEAQREVIAGGGVVVEGRDIGTVVAPDAGVKVYLTATSSVRAARRQADTAAEPGASVAHTEADLSRRDRLDSTRTASPLAQAPDAVGLDTTGLDLDQVVEQVAGLVRRRVHGR